MLDDCGVLLLCCFYVWIVCFTGCYLFWLSVSCLGIVCGCICVGLKLVFDGFGLVGVALVYVWVYVLYGFVIYLWRVIILLLNLVLICC